MYFQAGHVCGDQHDLVDGSPTGSIRVSFGYMSTFEDADKFLQMIESYKRSTAVDPTIDASLQKKRSKMVISLEYIRLLGAYSVTNPFKIIGRYKVANLIPLSISDNRLFLMEA